MTEHDLRAANPVPQHEVDALSLDGADTVLLEEIMAAEPHQTHRRWLPAVAAAAAVAVIGVGAVWIGSGPGSQPGPADAPGLAGSPSPDVPSPTPTSGEPSLLPSDHPSPSPPSEPTEPDCEGTWEVETEQGEATGYMCLESSENPAPAPHYQRPLRPFLLTAPGWTIDTVDGYGIHWRGPDDQELYTDWVVTGNPQDPFAYDRYDRPGKAIGLDGLTIRLTGFVEGQLEYQTALTEAVPEQRFDDEASILFETSDLGPAEFRTVVESLRFVTLEEFEDAAGR